MLGQSPVSKSSQPGLSMLSFCLLDQKRQSQENEENFISRNSKFSSTWDCFHVLLQRTINFAYSLVVGLLAGNANVVKVPSREFPQIDLICSSLDKLCNDRQWEAFKPQ